ncbi:ATP-binding protein [Streptomyces sp. IB2014 016-6]|uniref:ATP-binding protein n=1 Tax=Streptomyces sp. IB2014 016-6 TaxID=2517818 RepID=UPI0011C87A40|nr:ATP-binding protein [Streptomyces sp. IB2014 016-6]TXL91111.1 ATP-binding protein [Streptomyces sp. IB2014 016-6]
MVGLTEVESAYAEWTFPAEPDAVRTARHAVRDTLGVWRLDHHVRDSAVLLVSELVTNSLQYTSGPIDVRLAVVSVCPAGLPGAALLVEVSDPLPDPPTARSPGPDDEGGRGIQLVACSARRWGTRRGKTGKTVWFELPLPG